MLVAVKAHHTAAAAALLSGRLRGDGFVVSMQNGLNTTALADAVGADRVVEACVNFGADAIAPGVILRGNRATLMVGETGGSVTDRVRTLAADIADAQVTDTILGYVWAKEAYGAMLAATAVSDLSIADALDDPAYAPLLKEIASEVLAQAPVPAVPLDGFDPDDLDGSLVRLTAFNRRLGKDALRHLPRPGRAAPAHRGARRSSAAWPVTARRWSGGPSSSSRRSSRASAPAAGPTSTCSPPMSG